VHEKSPGERGVETSPEVAWGEGSGEGGEGRV
jgi:hypothetical protein